MVINADSLVVFDLDDTLYKESRYLASGIRAVAEMVNNIYGADVGSKLKEWSTSRQADIWGALCTELDLPFSVKESFLWIYRLHQPDIRLDEDVRNLIDLVKQRSAGVVILTDGRSVTQRLKVYALGLAKFPIYISEEWNSEKPSVARFEYIQRRYPAERYIYVGDNPAKDFKAPNQLGWETIGLRNGSDAIHSQQTTGLPKLYQPDIWVEALEDMRKFLC